MIAVSKLTWPGPGRIPTPELPYSVAQPGQAARVVAEPSGLMALGAQMAALLMYPGPPLFPPSRDLTSPGVIRSPYVLPGHIWAVEPEHGPP